jgi:hypothetical protein
MRVQQAKGDGWAQLFWPPGDGQAIDKFAASNGAEADRKGRICDKPIPAKGA